MKKVTTTRRTRLSFAFAILLLCVHPGATAQDITINLNQPRQRIDGVGFCHEGDRQNGNNYVINTAIQQMLDNHMSLFRDMFPNKTWEPSKGTFGYTDQRVINSFQRLKAMQDRGVKIILGIWDVPNWLVSNPAAGSYRKINNFDDFADFITSFLVYGKNNYGLTVDYIDINETKTSGINIALTAGEYITLIRKCQDRFGAHSLPTKMNLGSVLLWDIQYSREIYNAVKDLPVAGYPSWHTYRGGSTSGREPVSYWEEWGAWRQTLDRNLWGTETDYDAYYWLNADRLTWQGVEEMAVMYFRNYYIAHLSTSAGWFWHPEWPSNNVHIAYMNHFEPGGEVVECSQPDPDIMTVGYRHLAKGKFVLQVLNQSSFPRTVTFHGVPNGKSLTLVRTSESGDRYSTISSYNPDGANFTTTLQANSFNTFYGELGISLDTEAPTAPVNLRATGRTATSVSLAWSASSDNVGVTAYRLFNTQTGAAGMTALTVADIQNLVPGTTYGFYVEAIDAAGNTSSVSNTVSVTTDAGPEIAGIAISPNPAKDILNIQLSSSWRENSKLMLFDTGGRKLSSLQVNSNYITLDCQRWPAGLYALQVTNGKKRVVRKFIKQ